MNVVLVQLHKVQLQLEAIGLLKLRHPSETSSIVATALGQRESIDDSADARHGRNKLRHSPWCDQLYLPVWDTFIGE